MKLIYIFLVLLSATSCANTQIVGSGKELKLEDAELGKKVELEDIFIPLQAMQLEKNDLCMLKTIQKVEMVDSCYYILGGDTQSHIFVFDKDGHFLRRIGSQGHGKGEYISAWDFTVDRENRRVAILSAPSQVYLYSMDGTFIKRKTLGRAYCWNITSTDKGFVGATNHCTYTSGDDAYLLYFFDKEFNVRQKKIHVLSHQIYSPRFVSSVFFYNENSIYYVDNFTGEIYNLSALDKEGENYQILLSNPMPTEKFELFKTFADNQRKFDFLKDALIVGDKAVFVYIQNATSCVETMHLSGKPIVHGRVGTNVPRMYSDGNGNVILCISAYSYIKNKMEDFLPELKGKVKASDNYILVKCKLKDKQGN